jgi:outer membrane lipoprotein carrier protein
MNAREWLKFLFLPWMLFCLVTPVISRSETSLETLVAGLQKTYNDMESLQANFLQTYQSKRFTDSEMSEKGVVYLKKGGLMRWEYREPEKKVFISDGFFYYYYVPADKQIVKTPVDRDVNRQSPALFLTGRGDFVKDFRAEWADPRPGSNLVKLIPVQAQPDFDYLIVQIDPVRNLILRLLVVDSLDNRTEYRFTDIRENPPLPANFFKFQAPPGTDVIFQGTGEKEN